MVSMYINDHQFAWTLLWTSYERSSLGASFSEDLDAELDQNSRVFLGHIHRTINWSFSVPVEKKLDTQLHVYDFTSTCMVPTSFHYKKWNSLHVLPSQPV